MDKGKEFFLDYMSFQIGSVSRNLTKYFNSELQEYNVTIGQVLVLSYLLEHGISSVKDIAKGLRLENPATSRLIDRLIKSGLVSREESELDRRYMNIALTQSGEDLAYKVGSVPREFNQMLKEEFGEESYYKILEYMEKINEITSK